jgi:hypothetical protein
MDCVVTNTYNARMHVLNYQNVINPLKAYHTTGRLLALCRLLPYVEFCRTSKFPADVPLAGFIYSGASQIVCRIDVDYFLARGMAIPRSTH